MSAARASLFPSRFRVAIAGLSFALTLATSTLSFADLITLHQGQPIKGKLIADKAHPGQFLLYRETGKTPMVIKKDQITHVTAEASDLDDYAILLEQERPDAAAEFMLGHWCEEHKLKDLATVHYEKAISLDSTYEPAHRKLGHVQMNGRWMTADEVKEAQGLVKYQGHWMTPEDKARREAMNAKVLQNSSWTKRIKTLRDNLVSNQPARSEEAAKRLMALDDPIAVPHVLKVMGDDNIPNVRVMAARVLSNIPGVEATHGLVGRFLSEPDEAVRQATLEELLKRDKADIQPLLLRALKSSKHEVINRAAWALASIGDPAVVPKLIPVLITSEQEVVMSDTGVPVSGGQGIGFSNVNPQGAPRNGYGEKSRWRFPN